MAPRSLIACSDQMISYFSFTLFERVREPARTLPSA
jgi:hypothetical protein